MSYVKTDGKGTALKYPYNEQELVKDNPNTSFPKPIPNTVLARYGVFPTVLADKPEFDPHTQRITVDELPTLVGDEWVLQWQIIDLTPREQQKRAAGGANNRFDKGRRAAIPDGYDEQDIEVLTELRHEVQNFDNKVQDKTPLCAIVAAELGVAEDTVRDTVRVKGNDYVVGVVTEWAKKRAAKGGA